MEQSQRQRRPYKRQRKMMTNYKRVEKEYGLTELELDTLIVELAQRYNFQWGVVSNALFQEHQIYMRDRTICYRYAKIRPKNEKDGFDQGEQYQVLRLFFVEGKRYKEIREILGYRGEHSIRNTLYQYTANGLKKLQCYIKEEIARMPKEKVLGKCGLRKEHLISNLILNYGLKWDYNQYTLSLLYFFMVCHPEQYPKIPKELAVLLYKRLIELAEEKQQQKRDMYKLVDPQILEYLEQTRRLKGRVQYEQYQKDYNRHWRMRKTDSQQNHISVQSTEETGQSCSDGQIDDFYERVKRETQDCSQTEHFPDENDHELQLQDISSLLPSCSEAENSCILSQHLIEALQPYSQQEQEHNTSMISDQ